MIYPHRRRSEASGHLPDYDIFIWAKIWRWICKIIWSLRLSRTFLECWVYHQNTIVHCFMSCFHFKHLWLFLPVLTSTFVTLTSTFVTQISTPANHFQDHMLPVLLPSFSHPVHPEHHHSLTLWQATRLQTNDNPKGSRKITQEKVGLCPVTWGGG